MKSDLNDLKKLTMELMQNENHSDVQKNNEGLIQKIYNKEEALQTEEESEFLALPAKQREQNVVEIVKDNEDKFTYIDAIEEEEETKRGLYSGAVGYFSPEGNFDFNVVIRSILYNASKKYASFSVGSAITSLSVIENEYEECLLKAKALKEAMGA